jgi:hypothetical protein
VTSGEVHSAQYGSNKFLIQELNIAIDQAKQGCLQNIPVGSWCAGMLQMNMHFELYDMMSIIDGSRKCPNITTTENASEEDLKILFAW